MKKLLLIGMTLMMMSSCVKHPYIFPKLSEEDAATIPYQMGQTVNFIDQKGDTLTFRVVFDEIDANNDYGCYARTVVLACLQDDDKQLVFMALPQKEFVFTYLAFGTNLSLNGYLVPNDDPYNMDGNQLENVHHEILYSQYTGELLYDWYYSEEIGLLFFTKSDFSLTRIP